MMTDGERERETFLWLKSYNFRINNKKDFPEMMTDDERDIGMPLRLKSYNFRIMYR
jgi:hypothetical protein